MFIKVTREDNSVVFINADTILDISDNQKGGCYLEFITKRFMIVKESAEKLVDKINNLKTFRKINICEMDINN